MGQVIGLFKSYYPGKYITKKQGKIRNKDVYRTFKTSGMKFFYEVCYCGCHALKYFSCFQQLVTPTFQKQR